MHAQIVDELEKTWHQHLEGDDSALSETAAAETAATLSFAAPVDGKLLPLSSVSAPAFANGSMGEGIAIKPTDGQIFAPVAGTIVADFPSTRHALGIRTDNGIPFLIHVGVDTVEMQGTGFVSYVENGQHVEAGDKLMEFWSPAIKEAGHDDTVMIAFTKSDDTPNYELKFVKNEGLVDHGDEIIQIENK